MQTNRLTAISKYRNTIFLGLILLIIAILAGIIKSSSDSVKPVAFETQKTRALLPGTTLPSWNDISLNSSKEKIIEILGTPVKEETIKNRTVIYFKTTDKTPLLKHSVTIIDNKAVRISRAIVEYQENIAKSYFDTKYGDGKIIRKYASEDTPAAFSYQTNNYYTVIETYDIDGKVLDRITSMTNDEYDYYLKNDAIVKDDHHLDQDKIGY